MDERDLYDIDKNVIAPKIEHQTGVASASVSGGRVREIHVILDRNRLLALQMPVQTVLTSIASSNLLIPSPSMRTSGLDFSLTTESRFNQILPIERIILRSSNGIPIRIRDVGRVEDSYQDET